MKLRRGFTLIELLVVIAIIAILAAILFPVFAQARAAARKTSCASNLRQLGMGLMMYIQDYDELYPSWNWGFFCNGGNNGKRRDSASFWTMAIYPYVKNKQVYACANDILAWDDAWATCSDDNGKNDFFGPYGPNGQCNYWEGCNQNIVSYGLSETLSGNFPTNRSVVIDTPANWMVLVDNASQLSDVWVWQKPDDSNKLTIAARAAFASQPEGCCMMWNCCQPASWWNANYSQTVLERSARHQGGENMAFADGHVKFNRWSLMTWGNLTTGLK